MDRLSVRAGIKLDNTKNIQNDIQSQLDKISKKLSINISNVDISNLSSTIDKINKKISDISKNIGIKPTFDDSNATKGLNDYVSLVRNKVQSIIGETDKISKINIKTDYNGNFVGASVVTEIGKANQQVVNFNKNLQITSQRYTENDTKSRSLFEKQNTYLDNTINKLERYKKQLQESNNISTGTRRESLTSEIDKQINKYSELKSANQLLGTAEKARINETVNALKQQTTALTKQSTSLTSILKQMLTYAGGGTLIYSGIREVKQGINDVIALDSAMRDLRKVSSATNEELQSFTSTANDMAIAVGASTKSAIDATTYYSKLGLAIRDASESAKNAMIFSNIGDMDIDDASTSLITIQKGFDFDLTNMEDMIHIMDATNEVGNNFSSTTKDIADGLRQMGNASYEAGNTLEQSIGLFVAGNASIQDADKVGNAIKTITMRLRGMETQIDETSIPVSKLRDSIKQLTATTGQEVDIMKNDNTFKSTYEIMTELSQVYYKLTDGQRAYLQYVISGQRQGNIFSGMMLNMQDGIEATTTAMHSQGSAMKENYIYMQSIEGRINEFSETLTKVWVDAINTDTIKDVVSLGTSILNVVDTLINTFGVIPTTVGVATLAIRTFNKEMYDGITKNIPIIGSLNAKITSMSTSMENAIGDKIISSFINLSNNMKTATTQTAVLKAGNVALTASLKAVALASTVAQMALTMGISFLVTEGISAIVRFCDNLITTKEELKELNNQLSDNVSQSQKSIYSAELYVEKIEEINNALSKTNDITERQKLMEDLEKTQKNLSQSLPESTNDFASDGSPISTSIELTKEIIQLKKDEMAIDAMKFFEQNKNLSSEIESLKDKKKELEDMRLAELKGENTYTKKVAVDRSPTGQIVYSERKVKFDSDDMKKLNDEISDTTIKMSQANQMYEVLGTTSNENANKAMRAINDYTSSLNENESSADKNKNKQGELSDSLDELGDSAEQTEKKFKSMSDSFGNSIDKIELLKKAREQFEKTGKIDESLKRKIYATGDAELISTIYDKNTFMEKSNKLLQQEIILRNATEKQILTSAQRIQEQTDATVNSTNQKANAYSNDVKNSTEAENSKVKANTQATNAMGLNNANLFNSFALAYKTDLKNFESAQNKKASIAQKIGVMINSALNLGKNILQTGGSVSSIKFDPIETNYNPVGSNYDSNKTKKEQQDIERTADRYQELKNNLDVVNDALDKNRILQEQAHGQRKIDLMNKEIELLKKQAQAEKDLENAYRRRANELRNTLSGKGASFDSDGNISNYNALLESYRNRYNNNKTDANKKAYEDLKKLLDEYNDLVRNSINSSINDYEKAMNEIKNIQKEQAKLVADMENSISDKIKNEYNKRLSEYEKFVNKKKELYQREWQEQDEEDARQSIQDELKDINQARLNAMKEGNKELLSQLDKEYLDKQKELDKLIDQQERDKITQDLDDKLSEKQEEVENALSPENIRKLIEEAMTTGYVNIMGEMMKLSEVSANYFNENIEGTQSMKLAQQEYNDALKETLAIYTQISGINSSIGVSNRIYVPTSKIPDSRSVSQSRIINIDMKPNITLNGTNVGIKELNKTLNDFKQDLYETIDEKLG